MNRGICVKCNRENIINSKGLCVDCVYKNNHEGKTRFQIQIERHNEKIKKLKEQGKPPSSSIKYKPKKPTGERELFLQIWNERPHYCVKCQKFLGHEPKVYFFSHKKSKGSHPELRLVKDNIELLCEECHYKEEFGDRNK